MTINDPMFPGGSPETAPSNAARLDELAKRTYGNLDEEELDWLIGLARERLEWSHREAADEAAATVREWEKRVKAAEKAMRKALALLDHAMSSPDEPPNEADVDNAYDVLDSALATEHKP